MMEFPITLPPYGRKNSLDIALSLTRMVALTKKQLTLVEVGTIRGEDEAHSNGWSTLAFAAFCKNLSDNHTVQAQLYSVDISEEACAISQSVLDRYGLAQNAQVICENAHTWITAQPEKEIDLLYVDGWDYHLGNERESEVETLKFVRSAIPKLTDTALVLFDDNFDNNFTGKGKLAIPFLLSEGWLKVAESDNQVLLVRNWIYA